MDYKGLILDSFQVDAINSIKKNFSVVVSAPTGCGKTVIADFVIEQELKEKRGKRVIYTAPIKALSNQKFHDFKKEFGKEKVGLMTGDEVINPTAQVLIMTTEIYRNMVLVKDESVKNISYVVFDEIHYINDIERGYVWEESIIFSPNNVRFLCLSATIPNAKELSEWMAKIKKQDVDTIIYTKRPVPLKKMFYEESLGITDLETIKRMRNAVPYPAFFRKKRQRVPIYKKPSHLRLVELLGDEKTPVLFFCFSRMTCQKYAQQMANKSIKTNLDTIKLISQKLRSAPKEISLLKTTVVLKEILPKGIGFHHAGLIPILKEIVEELFCKGMIDVLYVTETFAVGINMPAKTVCFDDLRKFNGVNFGFMTTKEFFQMAGRAGRRGMDLVGFVVLMVSYRTFDYEKIKKITSKDIEPLHSQFRLSVNTVLNLLKRHSKQEIDLILEQSFFSFQKRGTDTIKRTYKNIVNKLKKLDFLEENLILTRKGEFASKIFCDEIEFTEMFATNFWKKLTTYEIALIIAVMVYEEKRKDEFYGSVSSAIERSLVSKSASIIGKKANHINDMSSIVYPIFAGKSFFEMLKKTSMDEGDLMRLFSQLTDRLQQLIRAADDYELRQRLESCLGTIKGFIKDIY